MQIMARLVILCSTPNEASAPLDLLHDLAGCFHTSLADNDSYKESIQRLKKTTEEPQLLRERWHRALLMVEFVHFTNFTFSFVQWLVDTIVLVSDGQWRKDLAAAFGKQHTLCNGEQKALLLRCVGSVLTKILDNQFLVSHIELLYKAADHTNPNEQLVCLNDI